MIRKNNQTRAFGPFRYYEDESGLVLRYEPDPAGQGPIDVRFEHDGATYVENSADRTVMLDSDGSVAMYVGDDNGKHGAMLGSDDSVTVLRKDGTQIFVAPDGTVERFTSDAVIDSLINGYEEGQSHERDD